MAKPGPRAADVLTSESPDIDRQDCTYDKHSDSVVDTLPTEGYCIFDARPVTVPSLHLAHATFVVPYTSFPTPTPDDTEPPRITKILAPAGGFLKMYWNRIMLAFVPLSLAAPYIGCNDSAVFILNCFAIIPLADMLCQATDSLASFMGETTGALVNVTMGNLTELVIFIQAMVHRQYIIVRTSLLGSIVVNILLVLGLAILIGEGRERGQVYNVLATRVAAGLLSLTTVSLLVPLALKLRTDDPTTTPKMTTLSRATSIILIVVYFLYLWTQIRSAKYAYKPLIQLDDPEEPSMVDSFELGRSSTHRRNLSYPRAPLASPPLLSLSDSKSYDSFDNDTNDRPTSASTILSMGKISATIKAILASTWVQKTIPIALLIASTGLISICSENLVSRVDHFVAHSSVSKTMVGLILLPIVGNAAELVSGIMFASRKQVDLAFAVSIGSAIQIALFVTPLIVLIGWCIDRDMNLQFTPFESITLVASSALFLMLVFDNRCSVLKGVCLCAGYTVIAVASYFVADG
ncbi:uncharacterized protein EKO05_0008116 [Ascochyta rabiei]|uniref:Calcium:proton antiporter n=1 Tax=Didymella rabiei TaxID=5454 RepID=A0A163AE85_DIDRA|nr:uncharacterized protein EKO05_0008116 [Ascochyta rabiei]KZM21143.1 calcium:proton antiporter [Ascochyta rabiei]UPX17778.1 hypothetical protein EKO05_0008116 [Ascochyta rabiei]